MQDVGSRVRAHAVVGAGQAERLLDHGRTARNTRCRVVLGVGDERCTHTQHELWVDFAVRVLRRVQERHFEFGGGPLAVGHAHVGLQVGGSGAVFAEVHPLNVLVLDHPAGKASGVALGDGFWEHERAGGDVEVFFFLSVHPFHDTLNDEGAEVHFAVAQALKVSLGQPWCTVVQNQYRAEDSSLVGVDENVLVFLVVANGHLRRDGSTSTSRLEVVHQTGALLVDAVDVAVDVNAVAVRPIVGLVHVQLIEALMDFFLVDILGNVDHLGSVLDQAAVLTLRGLVGAQATPLGGVKVTGLEMGLASHER